MPVPQNRLAFVVVLVAAVLLSSGCGGKEKYPERTADAEEVAKAKPDFSLSSAEFSQEYEEDMKAFQAKYDSKVVELTGVVKEVTLSTHRKPIIYLKGVTGDLWGVVCYAAENKPWLKVLPGQTVKLKGKMLPSLPTDTALLACAILEVSGPVPPSLIAEELAKEYALGVEAANAKYEGKHFFLSGEVADVKFNRAMAARVVLKTTGRPLVFCSFTGFVEDQTKTLKPGQKIKVLGQYTMNNAPDEVGLYFCILME